LRRWGVDWNGMHRWGSMECTGGGGGMIDLWAQGCVSAGGRFGGWVECWVWRGGHGSEAGRCKLLCLVAEGFCFCVWQKAFASGKGSGQPLPPLHLWLPLSHRLCLHLRTPLLQLPIDKTLPPVTLTPVAASFTCRPCCSCQSMRRWVMRTPSTTPRYRPALPAGGGVGLAADVPPAWYAACCAAWCAWGIFTNLQPTHPCSSTAASASASCPRRLPLNPSRTPLTRCTPHAPDLMRSARSTRR